MEPMEIVEAVEIVRTMEGKRVLWRQIYHSLCVNPLLPLYPLVPGGKLDESSINVEATDNPMRPKLVLVFQIDKSWRDRLEREFDRPETERHIAVDDLSRALGNKLPEFLTYGLYYWLWEAYERQSIYASLVAFGKLRRCAQETLSRHREEPEANKMWKGLVVDKILLTDKYTPYLPFIKKFEGFFGLGKSGSASSEPEYAEDPKNGPIFATAMEEARRKQLKWPEKGGKWEQLRQESPSTSRLYDYLIVSEDKDLVDKPKKPNLRDACQEALLDQVADNMNLLRAHLLKELAQGGMMELMLSLREYSLVRIRRLTLQMDEAYMEHLGPGAEPLLMWAMRRMQTLQRVFMTELARDVFHFNQGRNRGMRRPEEERIAKHLGLETSYYKQLMSDLAWELYARIENYLQDARVLTRAQWEDVVKGLLPVLPHGNFLQSLLPQPPPPYMQLSRGVLEKHCMCYQSLEDLLQGLVQDVFTQHKTVLPRLTNPPANEPDHELCGDYIRKTYLEDILSKQRKEANQLDSRPLEDGDRYSPAARATRSAVLRMFEWLSRCQCQDPAEAEALQRSLDVFWQQHLLQYGLPNYRVVAQLPEEDNIPNSVLAAGMGRRR